MFGVLVFGFIIEIVVCILGVMYLFVMKICMLVFFVVVGGVIGAAVYVDSIQPEGPKLVPDIPYALSTPAVFGTYKLTNASGRNLMFECKDCKDNDNIVCRNEP